MRPKSAVPELDDIFLKFGGWSLEGGDELIFEFFRQGTAQYAKLFAEALKFSINQGCGVAIAEAKFLRQDQLCLDFAQ
jgi:hypothetical protein